MQNKKCKEHRSLPSSAALKWMNAGLRTVVSGKRWEDP